MRNLFFFFLFSVAFLSKAQDIDVQHYRFGIELNDKNDTVRGIAEIRLTHLTNSKDIRLDLTAPNKKGKGMKVISATLSPASVPLNVKQELQTLTVSLPAAKKGDTTSITLAYQGIPDDGLIISKNKFGERTFFADNWPNRAHHWIPCIDRPDDKASFEFMVTAPLPYSVISNGVKVQEKELGNGMRLTHWKEDIALPTKIMVIGAARFAVKTYKDSPANIPVSAWVYPQDSTNGFFDFAQAPEILKFFTAYIGAFPYKKLANVQSTTIFGGMENASCIFYAEALVTGKRAFEETVAHEIAHQWFGDMASEKSFAHLWLSEGFATYLTNLYVEHKYGREAMVKLLQDQQEEVIEFATTANRAVVDSTENLMSLLNANSYQKGGWVLHMLRTEVGDAVFREIVRTYYSRYKGGNADSRDFEAVAEEVSGKELTPFFDQWLYRPGLPKLEVWWKPWKNQLRITQRKTEVFRLPLEVSYVAQDKKRHTIKLDVTQQDQTFQLAGNQTEDIPLLDPGKKLLFEAAVIKEVKPKISKNKSL